MGNYYSGMMNNKDGYGELKHFGILGMKWGVRRFQNADGSLTSAGRKRYYGSLSNKRSQRYLDKYGKEGAYEKYNNLSKKDKRKVDKAVKDLMGPNEFWRGNYEAAFKKSVLPPFKKLGNQMAENRIDRGNKALDVYLYKDSTKVNDRTLRSQMENNIRQNTKLQDNWDFRGKSAREERDLTKKFVDEKVKKYNNSFSKSLIAYKNNGDEAFRKAMQKRRSDAKRDTNEYMRKVAEIRLKSMGYDVTNKAIDNLVSKDWFKNSLWIQNTLASMGADGVNFTSRGDMKFR